jgi:hypothetical protein
VQDALVGAMMKQGMTTETLGGIIGMKPDELRESIKGNRRWRAADLLDVADSLGLDPVRLFRMVAGRAHFVEPLLKRHA